MKFVSLSADIRQVVSRKTCSSSRLKYFLFMACGLVFGAASLIFTANQLAAQAPAQSASSAAPLPPPMELMSPAFAENMPIPSEYTCLAEAKVKSPELRWKNAPKVTVSFVLLVHDLDPHPNKSKDDVLHWLVWDIPGDQTSLPENIKPDTPEVLGGARQGINQRSKVGWAGPCPPVGAPPHHYTFELFALDTKLSLPDSATRQDVATAIDGHVIGHGLLIGRFNRK
jgi:Raf kinase inhibitor-like YbhB/YbcL family protein